LNRRKSFHPQKPSDNYKFHSSIAPEATVKPYYKAKESTYGTNSCDSEASDIVPTNEEFNSDEDDTPHDNNQFHLDR
jgi:hypothetical protein